MQGSEIRFGTSQLLQSNDKMTSFRNFDLMLKKYLNVVKLIKDMDKNKLVNARAEICAGKFLNHFQTCLDTSNNLKNSNFSDLIPRNRPFFVQIFQVSVSKFSHATFQTS